MKKIKKLFILPLLIFTSFSLFGCKDELVVNNAFIYLVKEECKEYGYIDGEQWQTVYLSNYSSIVTAIPYKGYKFVSWSDGNKEISRTDLATNSNNNGPVVIYALFEVDNG